MLCRDASHWREFPGLQHTVEETRRLVGIGLTRGLSTTMPQYDDRQDSLHTPGGHQHDRDVQASIEDTGHPTRPRRRSNSPDGRPMTGQSRSGYRDRSPGTYRSPLAPIHHAHHGGTLRREWPRREAGEPPTATSAINHTGSQYLNHIGTLQAHLYNPLARQPVDQDLVARGSQADDSATMGRSTTVSPMYPDGFNLAAHTSTRADLTGARLVPGASRREATVTETPQHRGRTISSFMTPMPNHTAYINNPRMGAPMNSHHGVPDRRDATLPRPDARVQAPHGEASTFEAREPGDISTLVKSQRSGSQPIWSPRPSPGMLYREASGLGLPRSPRVDVAKMTALTESPMMRDAVVIDQVWWVKVRPAIELDSVPIREFTAQHVR